jgi:hypothetical protein
MTLLVSSGPAAAARGGQDQQRSSLRSAHWHGPDAGNRRRIETDGVEVRASNDLSGRRAPTQAYLYTGVLSGDFLVGVIGQK